MKGGMKLRCGYRRLLLTFKVVNSQVPVRDLLKQFGQCVVDVVNICFMNYASLSKSPITNLIFCILESASEPLTNDSVQPFCLMTTLSLIPNSGAFHEDSESGYLILPLLFTNHTFLITSVIANQQQHLLVLKVF